MHDIMKKGLVSVIMPCYNQGDYMPEAIESIISQTYPNWECIIIDDGSTDHSERVAKEYCQKDSRIRYIYQENAGVIAARNHAIGESLGEFILPFHWSRGLTRSPGSPLSCRRLYILLQSARSLFS